MSLVVEEERRGGCGGVREWVKCGTRQICSGKYAVYIDKFTTVLR